MPRSRRTDEKRHGDLLWIAKERNEDAKLKLELSPQGYETAISESFLAPAPRSFNKNLGLETGHRNLAYRISVRQEALNYCIL